MISLRIIYFLILILVNILWHISKVYIVFFILRIFTKQKVFSLSRNFSKHWLFIIIKRFIIRLKCLIYKINSTRTFFNLSLKHWLFLKPYLLIFLIFHHLKFKLFFTQSICLLLWWLIWIFASIIMMLTINFLWLQWSSLFICWLWWHFNNWLLPIILH